MPVEVIVPVTDKFPVPVEPGVTANDPTAFTAPLMMHAIVSAVAVKAHEPSVVKASPLPKPLYRFTELELLPVP